MKTWIYVHGLDMKETNTHKEQGPDLLQAQQTIPNHEKYQY